MRKIKNALLIQSFHSFTDAILYILIPLMMVERKIDITTIGLVFAAVPFIFQLARMGFAAISDMVGRRIFFASHGALTSVTSAIFYFAKTPFHFLYGNTIQAIRGSAFWSVNRAYVLDVSKEPRKDLVIMRTVGYIVWGISSLIVGFLIVWFLYSGALLLVFIIGLIGILAAFGIKDEKNRKKFVRSALDNLDFRKRDKSFKKLILAFIVAGLSYGFIGGYIFPLFLNSAGFNVETIGILIGMQTVISGLFLYVYTKKGNLSKLLLYGGILYAITLSILGFANLPLVTIVFLLFGIGVGVTDGCYEGIFTLTVNRKSYASDIGLLLFGMNVATSISQAAAGFLIQNFGFGIVFIISAAIFLIYSTWASKILR